jgi:hypothetical protein
MKQLVRSVILLLACFHTASGLYAQAITKSSDTTTKKSQTVTEFIKPKGPRPITHEMSVGIRLNSNGWSAYTDYGRVKSKNAKQADMFYNVSFWQLEVTEKKDPREIKSVSETPNQSGGTSSFIYGKINNFYSVKLGWGYRKLLVGKPDPGTVSIHWVNEGGFALGLLKPYYLNVNSDPTAIKFSDATESNFLDKTVIEGKAGFTKGLSELTFIPGVHLKSALHFDFSTNRKNALAVETGANFEYYSKSVSLLAGQKPTSYFFDIFLAFQYGRRW